MSHNPLKRILVCGYCEMPDYYHVDEKRDVMEDRKPCERDYLDWSSIDGYDYTIEVANNKIAYTEYKDYSGNEASITTLIDNSSEWEWDSMYNDPARTLTYGVFNYRNTATGADDKYDSWKDNERTSCTTAVAGHQYSEKEINLLKTMTEFAKPYDSASNLATDETRNAYVEGFAGYTTQRIVDEFLTRNYQARLLNVYTDKKTHALRCGSIEFSTDNYGVHARCVKCTATMSIPTGIPFIAPTREAMEAFTYAAIAHGNNHAAKWFTERETFYALQPGTEWVNNAKSTPVWLTTDVNGYDEAINFLYDHKRYCKDTNCKHDNYIDLLMSESLAGVKVVA